MSDQHIELKGTNFTLSVIHIFDEEINKIKLGLQEKVAQAPSFFKFAPIVINVSHIPKFNDWGALKKVMSELDLLLVGISGCKNLSVRNEINQAGIAVLTEGKQITPSQQLTSSTTEAKTDEIPVSNNKTNSPEMISSQNQPHNNELQRTKTKIVSTPIRSGQQIYARHADLVIMNNVGAGAEIIADGNIHVYGMMRGKALAGASGDESAKIFCQHLEAELISIAGNYWLSDKIPNEFIGQSVVINYSNEEIKINKLND
ncbi:septum site-determining protein MinC [Thorsellia kenyensis]|uniref:Probable septum site-determining protein MinC n=1 Tax=Thorsellia kenyensis TaxID=1549888 RepID=A0ABV6C860_9GAMM